MSQKTKRTASEVLHDNRALRRSMMASMEVIISTTPVAARKKYFAMTIQGITMRLKKVQEVVSEQIATQAGSTLITDMLEWRALLADAIRLARDTTEPSNIVNDTITQAGEAVTALGFDKDVMIAPRRGKGHKGDL